MATEPEKKQAVESPFFNQNDKATFDQERIDNFIRSMGFKSGVFVMFDTEVPCKRCVDKKETHRHRTETFSSNIPGESVADILINFGKLLKEQISQSNAHGKPNDKVV